MAGMTFSDYVRQAEWSRVAEILQRDYRDDFTPEAGFTLDGYQACFEAFRAVAPEPSDLTLCLERGTWDGTPMVDVFGRYRTNPDQRWAVAFTVPAAIWAGAAVDAPQDMSVDDVVAHCLAEWAWGGLDLLDHRPWEGDDDDAARGLPR
jgi:hypothetical protein